MVSIHKKTIKLPEKTTRMGTVNAVKYLHTRSKVMASIKSLAETWINGCAGCTVTRISALTNTLR